jgi:hypothetical protein
MGFAHSLLTLPGNTSYFHWAKPGEYVTQAAAIGPLGIKYVDDPRSGSSEMVPVTPNVEHATPN